MPQTQPSVPPAENKQESQSPQETSAPAAKPKNSKFYTIFGFVLAGILLAAGLTVFYLYVKRGVAVKSLEDEVTELQSQNSDLQEEIDLLTLSAGDSEALEEQIAQLTSDLADAEAENEGMTQNLAKIDAYNELVDYVFEIFGVHLAAGTPFTTAEQNRMITLARATGNNELVSAIQTAWDDDTTPVGVKVVQVMGIITDAVAKLT